MSATGLVVVYTTTGIFNFAQGAIGMFLAYVDWELTVNHGVPQLIAMPLIVLVIAPLIGIGLDRAIMRHLQGKELVVQLIVTVGLMFAFIGLANMIWNQNLSHTLPTLFGEGGFHIGRVVLTWAPLLTIVLAIVLAIGLRILLFRTRLGVAMRAVVDNRDLAEPGGGPLRARVELLVGARLLARRAGRHPARARRRHVDERPAHVADHHVVRGRRGRAACAACRSPTSAR